MSFIKEFKDFAVKGNVIDMAVGVIIGSAFGKIVNSLIEDVITPLLLKPAMERVNSTKLEELTILGGVKYGQFLAATINFIIIAFVLFVMIKAINASKKKDEQKPVAPPAPPEPSAEVKLLMEIRDSLKK